LRYIEFWCPFLVGTIEGQVYYGDGRQTVIDKKIGEGGPVDDRVVKTKVRQQLATIIEDTKMRLYEPILPLLLGQDAFGTEGFLGWLQDSTAVGRDTNAAKKGR
jgi:hypothetical protein